MYNVLQILQKVIFNYFGGILVILMMIVGHYTTVIIPCRNCDVDACPHLNVLPANSNFCNV